MHVSKPKVIISGKAFDFIEQSVKELRDLYKFQVAVMGKPNGVFMDKILSSYPHVPASIIELERTLEQRCHSVLMDLIEGRIAKLIDDIAAYGLEIRPDM